jgi:hypothetical protein
LITEQNLDRFDTTCLTWRHPSLSRARLLELLFECYRKFFSLGHALHNIRKFPFRTGTGRLAETMGSLAMSLFVRYCAWRRTHPMSGGVSRMRLDRLEDFLPLRKRMFGVELAPLPLSLQLPAAESQLNQILSPRRPSTTTESLQLTN